MSTTPQPMKKKRIGSIDGLKGLAAVWILMFHFLLAFAPYGHVGYGSGIAKAEAYDYYMSYYPYSCLVATPFALYLFFALIAYIPTLRFMKKGDNAFIAKQAVTRYFRLVPATLTGALLGYAAFYYFGSYHAALAESLRPITGAGWLSTLYFPDLNLTEAVKDGLYESLVFGHEESNSVLWCMQVVLLGSYLTYAVLLMFGKLRNRWLIYTVLFGLSFMLPRATAFLAGIAAADFSQQAEPGKHNRLMVAALMLLGAVCGFFPHVLLPSWLTKHTLLGMAAFFFLLGFARSGLMVTLLNNSFFRHLGKISFGILLVQFPVMLSFSAWVYLQLIGAGYGYPAAAALSFAATLPVVWVCSVLFYYAVEIPGGKLCQLVFKPFSVEHQRPQL